MGMLDGIKKFFGVKTPSRVALRQIQLAALEMREKEFISRSWVADQIASTFSVKVASRFVQLVTNGNPPIILDAMQRRLGLPAETVNKLGSYMVREGYVAYGVPLRPFVEDESLFFPIVNKIVSGDYRISNENFKAVRDLQGTYDALFVPSVGSVERRIIGIVVIPRIYSKTDGGELDIRAIAFEIFRSRLDEARAYIRTGVLSALKNMSLILLGGGNTDAFVQERRVERLIEDDAYPELHASDSHGLNVVSLQSGPDRNEFDGSFQYKDRIGKVAFFRRDRERMVTKQDLSNVGFFEPAALAINERDAVERLRRSFPSEFEQDSYLENLRQS